MPTGIQVVNTAGTILIDENYANLALRSKGIATTNSLGLAEVTGLSGLSRPIVALACSTRHVGPARFNSTLTSFNMNADTINNQSVEWYLFDVPLANSNAGLQIFDAAGALVFDSGNKYARVVDIFGGTTEASWSGTRTYAAGRKYAIAQLGEAVWRRSEKIQDNPPLYNILMSRSGSRVQSNSLSTAWSRYRDSQQSTSIPTVLDPAATFAVIDVTGY